MRTNKLEVKEVKLSVDKVKKLLAKYEKLDNYSERLDAQRELSDLIITYLKMELPVIDKDIALALIDDNTTEETAIRLNSKLDDLHALVTESITGICNIDVIFMLLHYIEALKGFVFGLENQILFDSFKMLEHHERTLKELENDTLFKIYKLTHETYNV